MGFGSYDESEQQDREVDDDPDGEGVSVRGNEHRGELSFETGASTDELVDQLHDIKAEADEEEDTE